MSENLRLKIVGSKPRIKKLLEFTSIDGELDTIKLKYSGNGLAQMQIDPSYTLAVISRFSKTYFTEFTATGEGEVIISYNIYKVIDKYFKELENLEISVKGNNVVVKGRDETYEGSLMQVDLPRIETTFEEREYGFVPRIEGSIKGIYGIDSEDWSIKADRVIIQYGDTLKLTVTLEEGGTYTRGAKVLDKREVSGSGVVAVDGKVLKSVIDLFSGPLYLIVTEGPLVLTQKTTDYVISYIIAPVAEG
jgi:hypothetical protein